MMLSATHNRSYTLTMAGIQPPQLNWEASATATHPQVSSTLPSEVETCLKNARFVSLEYQLSAETIILKAHRSSTSQPVTL